MGLVSPPGFTTHGVSTHDLPPSARPGPAAGTPSRETQCPLLHSESCHAGPSPLAPPLGPNDHTHNGLE